METTDQKQRRYEQMAALQAGKRDKRKKVLRRSRLDPYRSEIEDFARQGIGPTDIADWLARHRRVRVEPTTITRRLQVWARAGDAESTS